METVLQLEDARGLRSAGRTIEVASRQIKDKPRPGRELFPAGPFFFLRASNETGILIMAGDEGFAAFTAESPGDITMTQLLERAFAEAGKLSSAEQDLLAFRVLAELTDEDEFDRAIASSADKLASLANEALAEHRAGQTQELDPDRL